MEDFERLYKRYREIYRVCEKIALNNGIDGQLFEAVPFCEACQHPCVEEKCEMCEKCGEPTCTDCITEDSCAACIRHEAATPNEV